MSDMLPATPDTFLGIYSESKTRVFLCRAVLGTPDYLEQVTTVSCPGATGKELVNALNEATRVGDLDRLNRLLGDLPKAVRQSCETALNGMASPERVVTGFSGFPVACLSTSYFNSPDEVAEQFSNAVSLGLLAVITNHDEFDSDDFVLSLYAEDVEVDDRGLERAMPKPEVQLLKRTAVRESELGKRLKDGAWSTFASRAYWVWVPDGEHKTSMTAEVVIEHFDRLRDPAKNFLVFEREAESYGVLTPRNRFILWMTLSNICADLDMLLVDFDVDNSGVYEDMPRLVHGQERDWWLRVFRSAQRLCDAARAGDLSALVPRTVCEEALISLATRNDYVEAGLESAEAAGLDLVLDLLPVDSEYDGEYREILPELTGDADIEMLWEPQFDGVEDPTDSMNAYLGMGDYRPQSWHRLFDRAVHDGATGEEGDG